MIKGCVPGWHVGCGAIWPAWWCQTLCMLATLVVPLLRCGSSACAVCGRVKTGCRAAGFWNDMLCYETGVVAWQSSMPRQTFQALPSGQPCLVAGWASSSTVQTPTMLTNTHASEERVYIDQRPDFFLCCG